jgi:hypothetical protein
MFKKSTFSGNGGCVEVAVASTSIKVQDSKSRDATLTFTPLEWDAFVAGVKAGEFDLR